MVEGFITISDRKGIVGASQRLKLVEDRCRLTNVDWFRRPVSGPIKVYVDYPKKIMWSSLGEFRLTSRDIKRKTAILTHV